MNDSQIVNAFLCPEFYNHPVEHIELVETHISWVFLTGQFAYKIKKPVNFGFLDFSSLEKRLFFCQQELLLNRRYAPQIYLEVLAVTEFNGHLSLAGQGREIEYAIKMQQFDHDYLLDKVVKNQRLQLNHIDDLIAVVADFHKHIAIAGPHSEFGSEQAVMQPVEENFTILKHILGECQLGDKQQLVDTLHEHMQSMYQSIQPHLLVRKQQGHIRECHGDLHLANITLIDNKVQLFDGIEFNDGLRWIDTISDCAFLIMDLQDHKQMRFAHHFLNGYMIKSGDYQGLVLLRFYQFYRAMVRAKVAGLRLPQQDKASSAYKDSLEELNCYLNLANRYVKEDRQSGQLFLAISYGLSGSGKSWVSSQLADQLNALQVRSDVERKRSFANQQAALYSESVTEQTYNHLHTISDVILDAGYAVIADATFLDKHWRRKFRMLAQQHQVPFYILSCHADLHTIKQRLKQREFETGNVSDADIAVMENQLRKMTAPDKDEQAYVIDIDTAQALDYQKIIEQIRQRN